MKIIIPKIVLPIDLAEYAPDLSGKFLYVWVNQPREKMREYDRLVTDLQEKSLEEARSTLTQNAESKMQKAEEPGVLGRVFDQVLAMVRGKRDRKSDGIDVTLLAWYAEMWSQGPEDSRWTVDELQTLEEQDPTFLSWAIARSWQKRDEHIRLKKKV